MFKNGEGKKVPRGDMCVKAGMKEVVICSFEMIRLDS